MRQKSVVESIVCHVNFFYTAKMVVVVLALKRSFRTRVYRSRHRTAYLIELRIDRQQLATRYIDYLIVLLHTEGCDFRRGIHFRHQRCVSSCTQHSSRLQSCLLRSQSTESWKCRLWHRKNSRLSPLESHHGLLRSRKLRRRSR